MRVAIAGGHGKIALRVQRLLAARGDGATALVRDPGHFADVRDAGGDPVLCDLEAADAASVARHLGGADAVLFAAGAGPGSGIARKDTVDRGAAVLVAAAAEAAGVRRFVQISSGNVGGTTGDEVFDAYLRAKGEAEDDLRERDLDWTILRPGRLTDDEPTGLVEVSERRLRGSVPRGDVAAVVVALLDRPGTVRRTYELISGDVPVADAFGPSTRSR
ncbi:NAD(P)H-binding protein [Saccharothrix syringae]|uniref:NAD-dependent epimerase/dehydratase family protein n=1 Tax=Saccharothrix syringae TaxID=103733 RepID=A0A5Q0GRF2_SACSY|nr:NAD(P)H-binding protein [Saccharothrix syringae]QFZ16084.1 NAD-dependent epimerase/dehydratase family protein [Saccharothrix syringae]